MDSADKSGHTGDLQASYGPGYRADFLTLYQNYVASAERISDRRQLANTFFVTINTTLLGLHGLVGDLLGMDDAAIYSASISALAGCLMCVAWMNLIRSYKRLNTAKFAVILDMEAQLPCAPFTREWQQLQKLSEDRRHTSLSDAEKWVPQVFILLYLVIVALNGWQYAS
ncbi:MAG: hypothetical protein V2I82_16685 [Halieaceae bacterium]|jgi:hypothetical protein|nr:hypothetical protein [Halieaceae bacterium]